MLLVPLVGAFALGGLFQSVRATFAYRLYHAAKYAGDTRDVRRVLRLSERAHSLYPYNYYLCIHAAETAYHAALGTENSRARERLLRSASHWCDKGLQLNPHKASLQLLKSRLLVRTAPAKAAENWAAYVDRHFWEPYNHAMLVEFYALAGQFDRAMQSLQWTEGTRYHDDAARALREAWQREMAPPPTVVP